VKDWDFRAITDNELDVAIEWEYARESKKVRDRVRRFLSATYKDRTVKRILLQPGGEASAQILQHGSDLFSENFLAALLCFVSFPQAWMKVRHRFNFDYTKRHLTPISEDQLKWFNREHHYAFRIEWLGASERGIVKDFQRWLKAEKTHHICEMTGAGRNVAFARLKELAALRIHDAGYKSWDSHKRFFTQLQITPQTLSISDARVVPLYQSESGWHDAIKSARLCRDAIEASILR